MTIDLIQGTDAWRQARVGSLGASCVHEVVARTKTGFSAMRANRMSALIVERLTGRAQDTYTSPAMIHGTETEPAARLCYADRVIEPVAEVGLIKHPTIAWTHASPDGLVGDDGLLEIKCPQPTAHLEVLDTGKVPDKYLTQIAWQLACTGRQFCDFASYHPEMPPEMLLFVKRVQRDDKKIAELENAVIDFLAELDYKVTELRRRYLTQQELAA